MVTLLLMADMFSIGLTSIVRKQNFLNEGGEGGNWKKVVAPHPSAFHREPHPVTFSSSSWAFSLALSMMKSIFYVFFFSLPNRPPYPVIFFVSSYWYQLHNKLWVTKKKKKKSNKKWRKNRTKLKKVGHK